MSPEFAGLTLLVAGASVIWIIYDWLRMWDAHQEWKRIRGKTTRPIWSITEVIQSEIDRIIDHDYDRTILDDIGWPPCTPGCPRCLYPPETSDNYFDSLCVLKEMYDGDRVPDTEE